MDYLVITLIMLLGAFLQGLTGFGSGLIAVPLLAIYLPLTTITPTLSIINLLMATYLSWMLRRHVLWSQWKWLLCMGVLGTLLGNFLLAQVNLVGLQVGDRKSTRLNSSHVRISYAVFCLKKKS